MVENEIEKLLRDYSIKTDRVIPEHRPDLTLVDKASNKVSLIDVAVPRDSRAELEQEKKKEINTKTYELSSGNCGISQWK